MTKVAILCVLLTACFAAMTGGGGFTPVTAVGPSSTSQREAFARSAGYPTKHTEAELQALIEKQLASYKPVGRKGDGALQTPAAFTIDGESHTCYIVVMHLGEGAAWGTGAEAGLKFEFTGATGNGMGGPGVRGPGAVASLGCAEASGPITMTMAPLLGTDPIGSGAYNLEVFSRKLTAKEWADKRQAEADEEARMQRDEAERKSQDQAKANAGCSACNGRYEGCMGAGRGYGTCQSDYSSCAFEKIGADWMSSCPRPN
jgi:hypothetical protein